MTFNIKQYRFSIQLRSKYYGSFFKAFKCVEEHVVYTRILSIGRLRFELEDMETEHIATCAVCDSTEIGEVWAGDEGLTRCQDCGSVEQGYKYISQREYEEAS
jgi:hypothetical protein